MTQITDATTAEKNDKDKKIHFTVRTADGETAEVNPRPEDSLQSVLETVQKRTKFTVSGNQIPYFQYNGARYEDLSQPVSTIKDLQERDEVALLIRPRAG